MCSLLLYPVPRILRRYIEWPRKGLIGGRKVRLALLTSRLISDYGHVVSVDHFGAVLTA